jgi:alpha-aminoadipic semialdehyde synthase
MAVDNLPCEFPRESSIEFSKVLREFVPRIAATDFSRAPESLGLPFPIQKALVLQGGAFTPEYRYMKEFIK